MSSRKILTLVGPLLKSHSSSPCLSSYQQSSLSALITTRLLNTTALSPTVTLVSHGRTKHLRNRPDLSRYSSEGRPLSILICWLMAKNNAVKKYTEFYLDHGFDVLTVRITPTQLLLPLRVEPIVRNELLPTLLTSDHSSKIVHGFSVGGYVFARLLKYMQEHPQGHLLMDTMKAQIWDSVVDVNGVSIGVSKSVFNKNQGLQQALQSYIDFHMKAFYNVATKYYDDAHHYYYNRPLKAPALFLSSEADMISTADVIGDVQKKWLEKGIACDTQMWKETPHVGHMRAYPDQYKTLLRDFLHKHGVRRPDADKRVDDLPLHHEISHGIPNMVFSKAV